MEETEKTFAEKAGDDEKDDGGGEFEHDEF
jgi:hypothetical protein